MLDEIQHPHDKNLKQVGIEGVFTNTMEEMCDKPTANTILNEETLEAVPPKPCMSAFTTAMQYNSGNFRGIRQEKESKGYEQERECETIPV